MILIENQCLDLTADSEARFNRGLQFKYCRLPAGSTDVNPLPQGDRSATLLGPPCSAGAVKDNDQWFREAVQPHEAALRGYLRKRFPAIDPDDVVQESYLKLFKAKAAHPINSAKAFLFTIAANTARTIFRRERIYSDVPVSELPDSEVLEEGAPNATDIVNSRQQHSLLVEVVAELPLRCREIFLLRLVRGLTNAEIARELDLSEGTVRTQVARAMSRCTELLRERGVSLE